MLFWRRGCAMLPVGVQAGVGAFRSMISLFAVGGSAPPTNMILPSSYMAAEP
jgi:hypothetical protein